jgi:hypothetical protein
MSLSGDLRGTFPVYYVFPRKGELMRVGSRVLSLCSIDEDEVEVCRPGDAGEVVHVESDGVPLVRFARTGLASVVDPDTEVVSTRGVRASA